MKITPQQWEKAKTLFEAALGVEPERRASFLAGACADDDLLKQVQQLLEYHQEDGDFLNDPALNSPILNLGQILSQANQPNDSSSQAQASAAVLATASAGCGDEEAVETLDPMVGRRLGAYKLIERLGYGGMAAVYLAVRADDQYEKQVAVKVIRPELNSDDILVRFRTERQTLAALDHSNIVRLLDGGSTEEGLPYLVMEYVEGVPIDQYCDQQKLSIERRLRLFCEVCAAVEHAHRKLVVHRDLKPSNILVTADGTPKLLDFGIAKVLQPAHSAEPLLVTRTNMHRMTPAYASPEQVRGEPVTPASDIYCLGVVLYELLTGHRPYKLKQSTPAEIERAICEQEPENPSTAVNRIVTEKTSDGTTVTKSPELVSKTREGQPDRLRRRLRGDLDTIVLTALSKEVARRYSSAAEFSADIQRHLAHLPIKARRPTLAYRASRFLLRHKTEIAAAAVIVAVLLAAVGYTFWERGRSMEQARAELMNQRSRGRRSVAVLGFRNFSARPDAAWLSTALSEMLISELGGDGKLRMISGNEVAQMKVNLSLQEPDDLNPATLHRIHRNLGSDFVVFGSYTEFGEGPERQIRIDLRLQDAVLGDTIAATADAGTESNLSNIVARVGGSLRQKLGIKSTSASDVATLKTALPEDSEAMRLYSEGLARMRGFDALGARDLLEKAAQADPSSATIRAALADALATLGYETRASEEARNALTLSVGLPRDQALAIQARYYRTMKDWEKAADVYHTLFSFFPDNLNYGLDLSEAQTEIGKLDDAVSTLKSLRNLPPPTSEDPRIDLAEANTDQSRSDMKSQLAAAIRAQQKGETLGARLLVADALTFEAYAYRRLSQRDKAIAAAREAQRIYAAAGNRFGEAQALRRIASVLDDRNDLEGSRRALEQSLSISHALGDKSGEASALANIATIQTYAKDYPGAVKTFRQVLDIARELGETRLIALTLHNLGETEKETGEYKQAAQHFQEAMPLARHYGDKGLIAGCLMNLADVYVAEGRTREARNMDLEMVAIFRSTGEKMDVAGGLMQLAAVEMAAGNLSSAKKEYSEAFTLMSAAKEEAGAAYAITGLADIAVAGNHLHEARIKYEEALAIREKLHSNGRYTFDNRIKLASLSVEEGHAVDAEVAVRKALAEYDVQYEPSARLEADLTMVHALLAQEKVFEARKLIDSDLELLASSDDVFLRTGATIAEAEALAKAGKTQQANGLLRKTLNQATTVDFGGLQLEGRLALAEIEMRAGNGMAGRLELASVQREAEGKGFLLIAHKAAAARMSH